MDKNIKTFTKKWLSRILCLAMIDMQLPFVLAFLGREQIAETLGGLVVTEVIGVFLVYCAKSFLETKESEKIRIRELELGLEEGEEDADGMVDQ